MHYIIDTYDSYPQGPCYAGLGNPDKAIEYAKQGIERVNNEMDRWIPVVRSAYAHTLLGNSDTAIDALSELMTIPGPVSLNVLRHNPAWDPLREHPRFEALVAGDSAT